MSRRKGRVTKDDDEVETLLQAAEDELLLNLSIDSHVAARGSSSSSLYSLDPDLHRRFQALRSHPKPLPPRQHPEDQSGSADAVGRAEADEGDLFARFAALKENSNNNNNSNSNSNSNNKVLSSSLSIIGESDDEDDEVAKVMRWAVDAARLDPYDDDDDEEVEMSSCSTSDDDEEEDYKSGKEPKKTAK